MPETPRATIHGRVSIRPWRVGLLVDVDDAEQVRQAIRSLTSVWGGYFLPMLDRSSPLDELRDHARLLDLDSLYAENASGELEVFLQLPGFRWEGRGPWRPFSEDDKGFRKGLLKPEQLGAQPAAASERSISGDPDLLHAARWGITGGPEDPTSEVDYGSSPLERTKIHLRTATSYVDPIPMGFFVARKKTPRDIAWFWNCRALGGDCYIYSSHDQAFNSNVRIALLRNGLPVGESPDDLPSTVDRTLDVWGWDDLSDVEQSSLDSWASSENVVLERRARNVAGLGAWFPGFRHPFSRSFRVEIAAGARSVLIPLPAVPVTEPGSYLLGVVAAEVEIHGDAGLDPRLTTAVPPHRRHSELLRPSLLNGAEHYRGGHSGPVLAVQAGVDEVTLPIASNLDVMRILFDDPMAQFAQSDEGKFQSRAAEILGGPISGFLTQPGLRAVIEEVAESPSGLTLQQIFNVIERERGEWPSNFLQSTPHREYAENQARQLLGSGLLVPMLDVQCTFCRVVSRVHPADMAVAVDCDFCGRTFNLALALSLAKPTWRYRLAGHLAPAKVQAMMPVLSTISILGQMKHVEGPRMSHVLGLEVTLPKSETIEVDIAAILPEDNWIFVIGEVKTGSRIDKDDANHLGILQRKLFEKDVECILLFSTLKDEFSEVEQASIRAVAQQNVRLARDHRRQAPMLPLLLTNRDLSLPWSHDDHPWHWSRPGSGEGIVGTARESCRRHLGLIDVKVTHEATGPKIDLLWS